MRQRWLQQVENGNEENGVVLNKLGKTGASDERDWAGTILVGFFCVQLQPNYLPILNYWAMKIVHKLFNMCFRLVWIVPAMIILFKSLQEP